MFARDYAEQNRVQAKNAHIPPPIGATDTHIWSDDGEVVSRTFYGRQWRVADSIVLIVGTQYGDGSVARQVEVHAAESSDGELTAAQARELAAALLAAADELDRLNGDEPPFM